MLFDINIRSISAKFMG